MANITTEKLSTPNGVASEFTNMVRGAESSLEKMSHDAGEKVRAMASDFESRASGYMKAGRDYIQENPGKSFAMAAFVGLITGSLVTYAMSGRPQSKRRKSI